MTAINILFMLITLEGAFDSFTNIAASEMAITEISNNIFVCLFISKTSIINYNFKCLIG